MEESLNSAEKAVAFRLKSLQVETATVGSRTSQISHVWRAVAFTDSDACCKRPNYGAPGKRPIRKLSTNFKTWSQKHQLLKPDVPGKCR